ncbi:hypothetical protein F7725_013466 [Dissostichus mawsoni]|uniref:HAT C-terminal dimerisation domain-containing protein n=1 Tax=Dissostichus mawsoni TaxID=36200 RepID=A0A7J5YQ54_DISMA|nr:hypothetical protein F7725_013466 [Dissostichus mawsoni]
MVIVPARPMQHRCDALIREEGRGEREREEERGAREEAERRREEGERRERGGREEEREEGERREREKREREERERRERGEAEVILREALETEQPTPCVDEEEQESLGQGEGLFAAYHKRKKKDVGTTQLSHYLHIADGQNVLLFWAMNMKVLPSLFKVAIRVLAVPASSAPVEPVFSHVASSCDPIVHK